MKIKKLNILKNKKYIYIMISLAFILLLGILSLYLVNSLQEFSKNENIIDKNNSKVETKKGSENLNINADYLSASGILFTDIHALKSKTVNVTLNAENVSLENNNIDVKIIGKFVNEQSDEFKLLMNNKVVYQEDNQHVGFDLNIINHELLAFMYETEDSSNILVFDKNGNIIYQLPGNNKLYRDAYIDIEDSDYMNYDAYKTETLRQDGLGCPGTSDEILYTLYSIHYLGNKQFSKPQVVNNVTVSECQAEYGQD